MADQMDVDDQYDHEDRIDEFITKLESDPCKAELIGICSSLNQLLISLKYKRDELAIAEAEAHRLE
jgi:hypothetical protein